jgi:FkbM family methyltransferase
MTVTGAQNDPHEIHDALWADWKGGLAFDVGGNIGQSLTDLLERFERVVTFEPAAESHEQLGAASHERVTICPVAVSDHDGTVLLWEEPFSLSQGQLISPELYGFAGLSGPKRERAVPCMTLDSLAAQFGVPDFIKIDTEGHELKILQGAQDVLAKRHSGWLIEFHARHLHDAMTALLIEAGYSPQTVRHPHYPPGSDLWFDHGYLRAVSP